MQLDQIKFHLSPAGNMSAVCKECGRKFDMHDENDAAEWHYGHDCEA